jgi:hypothetical protein
MEINDKHACLFTKINAYKRGIGIVNDNHHQNGNQRRSSSRKSSRVWNEHQHGER